VSDSVWSYWLSLSGMTLLMWQTDGHFLTALPNITLATITHNHRRLHQCTLHSSGLGTGLMDNGSYDNVCIPSGTLFPIELWSKVVHYIGKRVPPNDFRTRPLKWTSAKHPRTGLATRVLGGESLYWKHTLFCGQTCQSWLDVQLKRLFVTD
jgi:hypothetical protein